MENQTKCKAAGCGCKSNHLAQTQWGNNEIIGFCKDHAPEWLSKLNVGQFSPETNMLGTVKSWYKKVA